MTILALLLLIGTVSAAAPDAAFSGAPLSGAAPLVVQFADTSTGGTPTGWAWFFGDETYDQTWTQVNANPDWSKRRAHTAVVLPDGDIILMGGWASGGYQNDTWRSDNGGTTWTQMNASSGWTKRAEHTSVAMPDGSIVLMGGFTNVGDANRLNDTWRSTDKGATWTQVNASPGWTARTEHTSVAIGNSILLMGGTDSTVNKNDVWRSTNNGATWTQLPNAGWPARTDLTAVAMPDDSIVIMGGQGGGYRNDVWRSDNGGTTWTRMTENAGWSGRESHTAAVLPDGGILLMGGTGSSGRVNDTWRSDDYGATWTQVNASPGWTARYAHTSVAMPDGSIVLMGGYDGVYTNDVWRLQTAGSTAENPTHTYTAAGTYPVALQAYNADGYDSTRQIDYITVTAAPVPPTAAFSANRTSGTAPLAVEFTDASTGSPIVWNWSFGDGAWHNTTDPAEKNPAHTYAAAGTYTVGLTASNAAGSDTHTEAGYITVTAAGALTAAFSGTPTTGTAPLTVSFTDESTGSPTGWAWFFGDETYGRSWVSVNSSFDGAMGNSHAAAAMPDGSIILMGGERGSAQNKTWRSTDYGASWTQLPDAEWEARQSHTAVAMQDGSVTVMGGYGGGTTYYNDTWQLNDGGTTWTRQAEHAGWAARYGHTSVVLSGDSILLMGGRSDINTRFNDTWRSDDGGATWTQQTENAEWEARDGHTAVAMLDGSVILMGGHAGNNLLNDTWRSTNGGETWTLMNESSGWEARYGHTAVAMPDGSVILMGGQDAATTTTYFNDVWRSTDGGATWTQLPDAGWTARSALTSVAMRDGSIVLMGGSAGVYRGDVSRLETAGSNIQNPLHEYDTPGTYTVTLQASNAGGYDSTRRTDYITVEGPVAPTAAFTGSPTSGAAPLTVSFTDTSTGGPTSWAWDFGDGATSTEQSPAHTYAAAGTYTVNLTASNAAGSDTHTEAGYITVTAAPAGPTAAFSGSPTSGAAPLTVAFTDTSTGSPTGWAWFFGDETYNGTWTEQTDNAGWSRWHHASVAMPDGSIVLMGGYGDGYTDASNDTFQSTDNGTTWTVVNASSGWTPRSGHTAVALPDGSIVLMGGRDRDGNRLNDTWRSIDGGGNWTCVNVSSGWEARWRYTSVAMPDGSIVLTGGDAGDELSDLLYNDTWRSIDGGAHWTCVNVSSGWAERFGHTSVAMPDGSIVLMGGEGDDSDRQNDVWRSTDGGAHWTCMNASSGWPARYDHTSVAMPDGSIVLMGGWNLYDGQSNDVWRSTDNGTTWTQLPNAGWSPRQSHTSVAMPDGSIVLMGGGNDVWKLQPAGSNAEDPMHTYTAPGTYTVTLQAFNAGGYDSTRRTDYITVSATPGGPTAAFTGSPTTGTAPLAVQFTDASTGSPIVWNWSFGDGAWHNTTDPAEKNPAHTYAAPGTYTVSLTASNAAGSDTHTEAGYITVTAAGALTAAFTGTPTSGTAPLTVSFTDTSTGSPTGWAWFFGDETYGEAWTQLPNAGWSAREAHTSVAMPDGSIVLMGGVDVSIAWLNDTWRSVDGGVTWTCVNASSGWTKRLSHAAVALPDGSIILMGGSDAANNRLNDTWRSIDGGGNWTCVNVSSGWEGRSDSATVAMPDGSIILTGGDAGNSSVDIFYNDTWRSIDGGGNWTCMNASSGWTARFGHTTVTMPDGSIILMGGVTNNPTRMTNDTWRSTDGGAHWTCMNASSGWTARYYHTSVAMPDGSIVLMGGNDDSQSGTNTPRNDTWRSTDNGATWTRLSGSVGWSARIDHTSVAMPDGSIILMGGGGSGARNDIWRIQPAGSSLQNPSHEYAAAGTYTVALQVFNDDGYSSMREIGHIAVSATPGGPTAAFTGTPTSGTAPLAVQFTDTSTGGPTSWAWDFGDGATSTEQSPAHTYAAAGTYTVGLTVDNAAGTDTRTEAGYITVTAAGALTAAFSGTPTTGTAPLTVSFTDESTGTPTGWAWFFGDETYGEAWTQVIEHAGWTARTSHASVVMPNGSIVLMGGRVKDIGYQNDTWRSDDSGMTWVQLPDAGWSVRDGHTAVAMPDGRIVLMGGNDPGNYRNDTWLSPDGGEHWERMTENAGWSARWRHASVVMPDGSIILMGGEGIAVSYNDTWRLADGETTWELVTGSSGWTARHGHTSVVMPNGNIVLMGGQRDGSSNYDCLNDTWLSTNGGETWTLVNESSEWLARCEHTSVVMPDGSILLMGGYYSDEDTSEHIPLDDVWRSDDGGMTWVQLPDAGWLVRKSHTAVAMPDGSILLMGGEDDLGTILNDVWQLQPAGSNARNPSHEYDTPGTYTVALQASNDNGYNAMLKTDYITVTEPTPTPTATPSPTSRPVYSGGGGGGSTGGPDGYNVGGDSAVSKVNVTGTGLKTFIITGWKQSSPGSGIPPAPPIVYQYIDLVPARFETITGANITFSVPAAWLEEHGFTPEEIVMYHYNGTAWEALPTWVVDAAGTTVTFRAATPGFSLFAITGIEQAGEVTTPTAAQTTVQAVAEPTATQTAAAPPGGPAPGFPLGTVALVAGAVLVLAAGGYLVRRWWMHRQNPALFREYD